MEVKCVFMLKPHRVYMKRDDPSPLPLYKSEATMSVIWLMSFWAGVINNWAVEPAHTAQSQAGSAVNCDISPNFYSIE